MINYEIKSQLAKLLATEDLVVENQNVDTACFDVETRVLTLPMWEKASSDVYDMLVGHEVGHALFTPNEWDFLGKIPKAYVNVTEDARIEKLMKRKYPGLSKSFYKGYKELSEEDFFAIGNEDISKMTLPDRVNLFYKIGNFIQVPFTPEEQEIVDLVGKTETFEEVLFAAEQMFNFVKDQQKQELPNLRSPQQTDEGESGESSEQYPVDSDTDTPQGDLNPEEDIDTDTESNNGDPFEVSTDESFTQGAQSLTDTTGHRRETEYYEVPKVDLEDIIVTNKEIHDLLMLHYVEQEREYFQNADTDYKNFKKSAQREVNYLVKEFECKKAADAYSRSTVARTGVLDCSKLHTYKYNEDLFRKVNVIPDGKNHGLIFVLDWSGSMCDQMEDTIKQLYNLVWFCSKVNIPFDVYAFTNSYHYNDYHRSSNNIDDIRDQAKLGNFVIPLDFSMMNILTSDVPKSHLDIQMKNLYRLVWTFRHYVSYSVPHQLGLSGTPLNEALVTLHQIIPQFKKQHQLQKVQCVVLTDGEAHQLYHWGRYNDYKTGESKLCPNSPSRNGYVRNRKTGHTYQIDLSYWSFTDTLLKDLKQSFPDTNFIGFRIVPPREFSHFVRRYTFISEQDSKKARKDKSYTIKNSGYESYFVLLQNSLSSDTTFNVDEGESKSKIKSAFMKSLKAKTLNKKVLSQFMDLVC